MLYGNASVSWISSFDPGPTDDSSTSWRPKRPNNVFDVRTPTIQRFFALREEFVPLVHRRYTGNRARLVVENFIGDMRRHAEPGHAGNYGASEVVQPPSGNAR
jgi:hypothetical protein